MSMIRSNSYPRPLSHLMKEKFVSIERLELGLSCIPVLGVKSADTMATNISSPKRVSEETSIRGTDVDFERKNGAAAQSVANAVGR